MGDAIMATPALRSIRQTFASSRIIFCANETVKQILTPCAFCDDWIVPSWRNPFSLAKIFKDYDFNQAILLKNSISSAAAVFLARIPIRIGYDREMRGIFLTEKLTPARASASKYKPTPATDYYMAIAAWLGCDTSNHQTHLDIDTSSTQAVLEKYSDILQASRPVVILVPGGAFGPSKCWPEQNFAATADYLIEKHNAHVFVSVAPVDAEKKIADKICASAKGEVINLGNAGLNLSQLKALFSFATIIITNDTGPRHIAIALGRKVITMFGPNDPAWTQNQYTHEKKIIADVDCAPCNRPICKEPEHICMASITPQMICAAADEMLKADSDE